MRCHSRTRHDAAMVRQHFHTQSTTMILHQQTDVPQCVTFTLPRGSKDAHLRCTLTLGIGHRLCQVIGLLFCHMVNAMSEAFTHFCLKRIPITDNCSGNPPLSHKLIGSTVTTHHCRPRAKHLERYRVRGIMTIRKYDYFLIVEQHRYYNFLFIQIVVMPLTPWGALTVAYSSSSSIRLIHLKYPKTARMQYTQ